MKHFFDYDLDYAIDRIQELLESEDSNTAPTYDALNCQMMCLKAQKLLKEGSSLFSKFEQTQQTQQTKLLHEQWWDLLEYFVYTPMKDVYQRNLISCELVPNSDLVELFCFTKCLLYNEMGFLVENELNQEKNQYRKEHYPVLYALCPDVDDFEPISKWWLDADDCKVMIYRGILLRDYFSMSQGHKVLKDFIQKIVESGSVGVSLLQSRSPSLRTIVDNLKDFLRFCQLLERYIIYNPEYETQWDTMIRSIIEMSVKAWKLDMCLENFSIDEYKVIVFEVTSDLLRRYHLHEHHTAYDWILELALCWDAPLLITAKEITMDNVLHEKWVRANSAIKENLTSLHRIILLDRPLLNESWFYNNYKWRFTMQERRIRDLALDYLEVWDVYEAKKYLLQLKQHKEFFRYQFNIYSISFVDMLVKGDEAMSMNNTKKALMYYKKAKTKLHDWRRYIVEEYPTQEIKKKLQWLTSYDLMIERLYCNIYDIPFDPNQVEPKNIDIPQKKKTWRNEPCPCNSGKKFKRCCGV
jgi:hypothetical protein